MQKLYQPHIIEQYVQNYWEKNKSFQTIENSNKEKYYCLSMLPYPSGKLHMGHVRNYTIGDVISRYQRMLGKNVLQPIGWDAFGLPAENAAIENNTNPLSWTFKNIHYMKKQLKMLGFSYDWDREIITSSSTYYHWEQWFFIKLYKKGLVYKKKSNVNWCPYHLTVLANEQVINGCCWRCDTPIEYKNIPQWFIKITHYAEELYNDLDTLDEWPEQIKNMQRNWIGRSKGLDITFNLTNCNHEKLTIYTTHPNVLMGATYLAISIFHPLAKKAAKTDKKIHDFIIDSKKNTINNINTKKNQKQGITTNFYAIHPLTNQEIPIWIDNYLFIKYNIHAIIAIPGHNQYDWEFATQNKLPIKTVIIDNNNNILDITKKNILKNNKLINSGEFDGMNYKESNINIINKLISLGIAKNKINYRLRDWCISRQRYWGAPIPMLTTLDGSIIPMPENRLPVVLQNNIIKKNNTFNIKSKLRKTIINGQIVTHEIDTFDTFIESSWYYARYTCPHYHKSMLNPDVTNYWLPIDLYIGGIEHAVMHLLYFRFFHKLMRDEGLITSNEPAKKLLCQGMVLSDTFYYLNENKQRIWVSPNDVIIKRNKQGKIIKAIHNNNKHQLFYIGMTKMSKSKNNGIDPQTMIKQYGADTVRLFIMFAAPPEFALEWKETGIKGAYRFIHRLWNIVFQHIQTANTIKLNQHILNIEQKKFRKNVHETIIKVTKDFSERYAFNSAIASIMTLINNIKQISNNHNTQNKALIHESLNIIIRMLSPIIPHVCFIMWKALGYVEDINYVPWPTVDQEAILENTKLIIIQINGKKRDQIIVDINATKENILKKIYKKPNIMKYIKNKKINKIIYISNKLINLVIN